MAEEIQTTEITKTQINSQGMLANGAKRASCRRRQREGVVTAVAAVAASCAGGVRPSRKRLGTGMSTKRCLPLPGNESPHQQGQGIVRREVGSTPSLDGMRFA